MKMKGMKSLRAEFPKADYVCQVKVMGRSGATVDVEGPATSDEVRVILAAATGQETQAVLAAAAAIRKNDAKNVKNAKKESR